MHSNPSLSQEVGLRRRVAAAALEIFAGWSYREIDVPLLDYFDQLREVMEPSEANRTFRLMDRDGNLLVLRSDVTPAIARSYAHQLQGVPLPLRVCYANKVVRLQRAFTREQSESYQLGVELIGATGMIPEVEVLLICLEVLQALRVPSYQVNLGHVGIYRRLLALAAVPRAHGRGLQEAIARRDAAEVRGIGLRLGLREEAVEAFAALAALAGGERQLDAVAAIYPHDEILQAACKHLRGVAATLAALGHGERVHLELGLVDGPTYYTGLSFRIVARQSGRALGGGGRYDDLIGMFGPLTAAVGFALQLDVLMGLLYPAASSELSELEAPSGAAVRVEPQRLVEGFAAAVERRRRGEVARIVARSGGAPVRSEERS